MFRSLPLPPLVERLLPPRIQLERRVERELLDGEPELRLIPFLRRPDTVAVDVGANHGVYTYLCAREFSRVIAFEPNPRLAERLRQAFGRESQQAASTVVVRSEGVSDTPGEFTLRVPMHRGREIHTRGSLEHSNGQSMAEYVVRVTTLDSAIVDPVGLIKIDVEGHELNVLSGAAELIDRSRPAVIVEAEERHRPGAVGAVASYFSGRGYSGYCVHQERLMEASEFEVAVHQHPDFAKPVGGVSLGPYIANFIFLPSERPFPLQDMSHALKRRR